MLLSKISDTSVTAAHSRAVFTPFGFFHTYETLEDGFVVVLSLMDQCRIVTEELVKFIQKDKKVYRNNVKRICNKLYNPNGNTIELNMPGMIFKGWTKRVETKILKNMSESAQTSFAIMNGEMDDLIRLDLVKFYNSISIELGKYNFKNKEIVDKTFRALFFADMCRFIIEICLKKNAGINMYLVKEYKENMTKRESFHISNLEVTRIYDTLIELTSELLPNIEFQIPDDSPVATCIDIMSRKLIDPHNVYRCAEEAGLDLRKTSNPINAPEAVDARRAAARVKVTTKEEVEKEKIEDKLESLAEKTGWKIEIAS